jgi:hypothetical protein
MRKRLRLSIEVNCSEIEKVSDRVWHIVCTQEVAAVVITPILCSFPFRTVIRITATYYWALSN